MPPGVPRHPRSTIAPPLDFASWRPLNNGDDAGCERTKPLQVFIVGCARSGTSVVYRAVREVLELPGEGEGHVLPIFVTMMHNYKLYVDEFKGTNGILAEKLELRTFRTALVDYIQEVYFRFYPGGSWVDKTPGSEATVGATFIVEAFPDARIIATRRTGVEVVNSFQKKFSATFEDSCEAWAASMGVLEYILRSYPQILCIDQFDLANRPRAMGTAIADHFERPEKADAFADYLTASREDKNSAHSWEHRLTAKAAGWSEDQIATFTRICGDLMHRFDYSI